MAPIVAPGVCRFTVEGTLHGQDCFNIFDMDIDPGPGFSRADAIPTIAGDLLNQWSDHILPIVSTAYTALRVAWIDLNSLTGVTGNRNSTDGSTWPENGGGAGAPMPGNVALRMRKNIDGGRGQRAGSMFVGGTLESWTDNAGANFWQGNVLDIFRDAFEDLKDGLQGAIEDPATVNLVVIHTVDDVYTAHSNIISYEPVARVAPIGKRLPGRGT